MTYDHPDPLLAATKGLIALMKVLLILTFVGLCFGVVMGVIGHGAVVDKVVAAGAPPSAAWGITGFLALLAAEFIMAERFLRRLDDIVASVGGGDPFAPANARRLEQMGWLAMAMNLVVIPVGMLASWLVRFGGPHTDLGFSFAGLVLTLVLFILARVFRQGAAMREELEGTI
jgi:hypothetical protein